MQGENGSFVDDAGDDVDKDTSAVAFNNSIHTQLHNMFIIIIIILL